MIHFNQKLLQNKGKMYVAFSCGIDSIACLHYLHRANKDIVAWHFNHKMIPEDDQIAEKARVFCDDQKIPLIVVDNVAKVTNNKLTEHVARNYRYGNMDLFFAGIDNPDERKMVVCHHLDDCVESYLMKCFNGNPEYKPIPEKTHRANYHILRPFLFTTREDIESYVKYRGLDKFVAHDPMSDDMSLKRNFVRKKLRPIIEEIYPGIETVVRKKLYASD